MKPKEIIKNCKKLLLGYKSGKMGYMKMPEDTNPGFSKNEREMCLAYFTLPMALNYQRNSYTLRENTLQTYQDKQTKRENLLKYKVALQHNKHIKTRQTISTTIATNWGSIENLFTFVNNDFLQLKTIIQKDYKSGFPYLSGPKIFNYWSFIIQEYGDIKLNNSDYIDIAPDTHITKCSIKLGVITEKEAISLTKEQISQKWRDILKGTGINPINMHSPLWFRSRNNFTFKL